ncbi:hypothetical protein [Paenibacillus rigui]|uniref:Uncharacterized protein n=1 Tax=Paenibacillus rigui TaxID=554312 RepID=A0A229UT47_9BACL|nr:hypothetical protein [Paenibacillus rigui]OXM86564.1 hypothetical protein CF651_08900 [Paenibacillus rigui]
MDIYTTNGNIIRQFPREDGTTEVELEFLFNDLTWSRLFSMCIYYVAFHKNLHIDYVITSYTHKKVAVQQKDFDKPAQQVLIETMLRIKDNANLLNGLAQKYLIGKTNGVVVTNKLEQLEPYKVAELEGQEFLEKLTEALDEAT